MTLPMPSSTAHFTKQNQRSWPVQLLASVQRLEVVERAQCGAGEHDSQRQQGVRVASRSRRESPRR